MGYGRWEDMDEHFLTVEAIITDLTHDTENVIELANAKKGIINVRLIPIESIIANLKEAITSQLSQGLHFPSRIAAENWANIEKFINAYNDNSNIYTIIKSPLIIYAAYDILTKNNAVTDI